MPYQTRIIGSGLKMNKKKKNTYRLAGPSVLQDIIGLSPLTAAEKTKASFTDMRALQYCEKYYLQWNKSPGHPVIRMGKIEVIKKFGIRITGRQIVINCRWKVIFRFNPSFH